MKGFECYEFHRANMPQYGCTNQCKECREKQGSLSIPYEDSMMEVPMPISKGKDPIIKAAEDWVFKTNGYKWSNNDDTAGDNYGSFKAGAEWMAKRTFTRENVLVLLNLLYTTPQSELDKFEDDNGLITESFIDNFKLISNGK